MHLRGPLYHQIKLSHGYTASYIHRSRLHLCRTVPYCTFAKCTGHSDDRSLHSYQQSPSSDHGSPSHKWDTFELRALPVQHLLPSE